LAGRRLPGTRQRLMAVADRQEPGKHGHRSARFGALQYKCLAPRTAFGAVPGEFFQ